MMFPILISVSVAPGSYFFCALTVVTVAAATTNDTRANWLVRRTNMVSSRLFFASVASRARAGKNGIIPCDETSCCGHPDVLNMRPYPVGADRLEARKLRIGPRYPRLGDASFRFARWLARKTMGRAGFHDLGSAFANARLAQFRGKLARGETVYLAGLGLPGTHNAGVSLVEVTQAQGPRLIVNNEEERFSGNKHTTEYPRGPLDALVATLRSKGLDAGNVSAWLTNWDFPALIGTLGRSIVEEFPQGLNLLR